MKPVVYARLNWGNWIADCPVHGEGIAELVEPGKDFICSRCYPNLHAEIRMHDPRILGKMISVPDLALRALTRNQAERMGHVYRVVFPKDMKAIMEIVGRRPLEHQNWRPGVSLADLRRENKEHGVK